MPEIARFYGIVVYMYYFDHNPPHLHAQYGRSKAMFRLSDGVVLRGELPVTGTHMVSDWIGQHREELMDNWRRLVAGEPPEKVVGPDGRD